jgi:hypothetical protein
MPSWPVRLSYLPATIMLLSATFTPSGPCIVLEPLGGKHAAPLHQAHVCGHSWPRITCVTDSQCRCVITHLLLLQVPYCVCRGKYRCPGVSVLVESSRADGEGVRAAQGAKRKRDTCHMVRMELTMGHGNARIYTTNNNDIRSARVAYHTEKRQVYYMCISLSAAVSSTYTGLYI